MHENESAYYATGLNLARHVRRHKFPTDPCSFGSAKLSLIPANYCTKRCCLFKKKKKKGGKILSEILDPLISVGVLLLGISKADATLLSILTDN